MALGLLSTCIVTAAPAPDASGAFGSCNLNLGDPDGAWKASKAAIFLDSLMYQRGSGKLGSVAGLDKIVDERATGFGSSLMDCTDLINGNCGPYQITDCPNAKEPVWFWLKVAFSNFYAYYNKLSQQIGWETLEASLEVQNICDDVKNGWDQDPIHISTLYNHVGAGMGIAGSVLSNVPGVGPLLGIGSSVMGAYFSIKGNDAANVLSQKAANAQALQQNAVHELNDRLGKTLRETQDSLAFLPSWLFQTGNDWPNNNPPKPDFDAGERYLPTQMFGKGIFLNEVGNLQIVKDTMSASIKRSLFGMGLKANGAWATWASPTDTDFYDKHKSCNEVGWLDEHKYCWTVVVYASSGPIMGQGFDKLLDRLKNRYGIDPHDFFKTILDCSTNPTPDGEVDPSGAPGVAHYPKCFFSLGVTSWGAKRPVKVDIPGPPWGG